MKLRNVVVAIFLWLCIPVVIILGTIETIPYALAGERYADYIASCICGPSILVFIIGLIVLILGIERSK